MAARRPHKINWYMRVSTKPIRECHICEPNSDRSPNYFESPLCVEQENHG